MTAAELAAARVAAARDEPAERLALAAGNFDCGASPRCSRKRFGRSEVAFLRAEIARGVLAPTDSARPGSPWWRAVNERLLRDAMEARLLAQAHPGPASAPSVELWLAFAAEQSAASWYRAHNASIVAAYLEHETLARLELLPERYVLNLALLRVLYAHALAAAPRLALGRFAPLGRLLGDPRRSTVGLFLSIRRVFPDRYPLTGAGLDEVVTGKHLFLRSVDYGLIGARLEALYEFAARSLGEPRLEALVQDGVPSYVWPSGAREPWVDHSRGALPRLLAWATGAAPEHGRPLRRIPQE